jgi:cytoskeletal protein CcmA (bactofilin family)/predicted anti-sigma-YlaC factor YlaD
VKEKPSPEGQFEHLDEMTCLLYIERQLDRARGQQVSEHVQECTSCRTLLRALERESRLLTRAMLEDEEAVPARLARFQERARRSLQWIWGLALGLAATGVYALYTGYVEPWQRQLEQAGFGGSNLLSLLIFQGALWKGWQSMATLLEVLALLTVGIFALALFRRRMRRGSALALVFAGMWAMLIPGAGMATTHAAALFGNQGEKQAREEAHDVAHKVVQKQVQNLVEDQARKQAANSEVRSEARKGESVIVSKDEVINGDIFLFGARARVDGTVKGDVFVFSHDATVTGHVEGDIFGFAQLLEVTGQVDGNIRAFTNTLTVRGKVARNVLTFDERVNLDAGSTVGGSLTAFADDVSLDGMLGRDVRLFAKHLDVSGKVGGGMRVKAGTLAINGGAQVDGPIRYDGDEPPQVSPQAKLASPVDYHKLEHKPHYEEGHYYIWRMIWTAAFILFGMVLVLLMPRFAEEAVRAAELYGAPIGLGVLVFFGVPIAAVIACVTVVGIPLGVLALGLWFLTLCCAELVVGAVVGSWILGKSRNTWGLIGRMALGFVIVRIVYTIVGLVHVGAILVALAIWFWGMGAISLALYRRMEHVLAPAAPAGPYGSSLPPTTTVGGIQPA